MAVLAPAYLPRRPTATVLYGVVRRHLETFLAHARESYEAPLPRYVEKEFRGYLSCGIFSRGFIRCLCDSCGHELLVAFSCKGRGVCPSCSGRRMANTGAHLVDRVVPNVPVRQFVLSIPYELRRLAAFDPIVLTALNRIFVETVLAHYRACAKRSGDGDGQTGSVTLVQRFGGSLNLHVHYHCVFLDGVFTRNEDGGLLFHPSPPPTRDDLQAVVRRVHDRARVWLRRHGHLHDPDASMDDADTTQPGALDACAAIAMQRGSFAKLPTDAPAEAAEERPALLHFVAEHEGWNLHAGVHIAAGDDLGRERLLRYGARPAFALDRFRLLPDGRIGYRVKYARPGSKHRVMTPLEMLARLSSLIPPPRFPLVRFHGVLGPRSAWRRDVVPKPRERERCEARGPEDRSRDRAARSSRGVNRADGVTSDKAKTPREPPEATPPRRPPAPSPPAPAPGAKIPIREHGALPPEDPLDIESRRPDSCSPKTRAILLTPSILSTAHWNRLADGELHAATRRVPWRDLLRRTFDVDVERCPRCGDRLRVLGAVLDPHAARAILERLELPATPPRAARARDPTELVTPEPPPDAAW